jgi:hypothetical protein
MDRRLPADCATDGVVVNRMKILQIISTEALRAFQAALADHFPAQNATR